MRVMVIVKATASSEAGTLPSTELLEAMGRFNEELVAAGIMQAGDGLKPSSAGKRIAFDGASRTVIDGPFAETKELIAGFWIWQVKDLDEAVAWVKRCPNPMPEPSEIEIRPLYEMADFGEAMTPDLVAQEDRLRATLAGS
ncbi:YciI family protein [Prosthecomicrobium hirschii]|uniref:Dehydrogenase n=1 Tax=Prosthecodimorpha hirschii TaxID=665126 RepID=A0A0P6VVV8_9HYPH|nr:YciI family protein [Prosthecomicrobium hirschii]KPL55407.1 dehydrogenase [Prosthecomicrobium hirschii]MCW1839619.1 YciI family protein [Prosthecomicrobium hirschii]